MSHRCLAGADGERASSEVNPVLSSSLPPSIDFQNLGYQRNQFLSLLGQGVLNASLLVLEDFPADQTSCVQILSSPHRSRSVAGDLHNLVKLQLLTFQREQNLHAFRPSERLDDFSHWLPSRLDICWKALINVVTNS